MLLWAVAILVVGGQLLASQQTGDDGFLRTRLVQPVDQVQTGFFEVMGTQGFPKKGILLINREVVRYSAKNETAFLVIERGRRPRAHEEGAIVQTADLANLENLDPLAGDTFISDAARVRDWAVTAMTWNYPFLDNTFGRYFRIMVLIPMNLLLLALVITKLPIPGLKIFSN